jgi:hypothetical protein
MEDEARSLSAKAALPIILMAAVIQGWTLYGLHHAVKEHHWPATDQAWLIALYALAVFIPVSVQLLAEHARGAALWRLIAVLAVAYFYFGWHHGAAVATAPLDQFGRSDEYFSLALLLTVLWLLLLPFAQGRLAKGHWTVEYNVLFANAWRNKLVLAEAALFTGLFWLLLFLWQTLFHMLGIDYFRELFQEPIFVYPVTSLTFGCALHLIGSIERLTSVVLEQILNVLKWLALLAGVILTFFTIALVFKLPGLLFTGQKAIGAAWLLWLIAVVVLLLNAAYRDGSISQPYPKWIALFLRVVVPLTVIISLTALYALIMRSQHYGLTVERVWAFVVAGAALLYSVGYSAAVLGKGPWLGGIARVNVVVAIALIAVIAAALTPLLSPYRLAANSQFRLVRERGLAVAADSHPDPYTRMGNTSLQYLRFDSGRYGLDKLQELAKSEAGKDAENIRRLAGRLLAQKLRWEPLPATDVPAELVKLRIYPAPRTLDQALHDQLVSDMTKPVNGFAYHELSEGAAGIYIDLNGDKSDEFVLLTASRGLVYVNHAGHWDLAADIYPQFIGLCKSNFEKAILGELAKDNMSAVPPAWNDLSIGGHRLRVNPHREPTTENCPPQYVPAP